MDTHKTREHVKITQKWLPSYESLHCVHGINVVGRKDPALPRTHHRPVTPPYVQLRDTRQLVPCDEADLAVLGRGVIKEGFVSGCWLRRCWL